MSEITDRIMKLAFRNAFNEVRNRHTKIMDNADLAIEKNWGDDPRFSNYVSGRRNSIDVATELAVDVFQRFRDYRCVTSNDMHLIDAELINVRDDPEFKQYLVEFVANLEAGKIPSVGRTVGLA